MTGAADALAARITALGLPALMNDTCFLLDIIRDPTRDTVHPSDRAAAMKIVNGLTGPSPLIVSCIADQVHLELDEHREAAESEAANALRAAAQRLRRMDDVFSALGGSGITDMSHLHGHGVQAGMVLDKWLMASERVAQEPNVPARAFDRVNQARTPARKGSQSMKDCVVIETYLDLAGRLRGLGFGERIVFASSNTKDYAQSPGSAVKADLAQEFSTLQIEFAPNFGAASFLLGLTA
jgi:hypothetical protein